MDEDTRAKKSGTEPPRTRRRRGRPRKAPEARRTHRVPLNLSERDLEALDRNRGDLGRQDYLRLVATRGRRPTLPVPEVRRQEFIRLYQMERDLERMWLQIGRSGERLEPHAGYLRDQLGEIHEEILRLRRLLLGLGT